MHLQENRTCHLFTGNVTTVAREGAAMGWRRPGAAFRPGSYEFGVLWNMPNFGTMAFSADGELQFAAHDVINGQVAEAPWSVAEWAVAPRFDNPRAAVLVLVLG